MKILYLILFVVAIVIPSETGMTLTNSPIETNQDGLDGDTLKALGLLVEKYKVSNNPLAIKYAKTALAIAQSTDSPSDIVDAYKWLGKAYLKSQTDSSYYYLNLAIDIAGSNNLVEQKVTIYYNIASLYSAASKFDNAISLLDSSKMFAEQIGDNVGIADAYNQLGYINGKILDFKNSRIMYDSAYQVASRDSLYKQMGVALGNLARRPFESDTATSINLQKKALSILGKVNGVEEEMAYIYINIGGLKLIPDSALYYYKIALNLARKANLPNILYGACNNMAYSYLEKNDLRSAEACLKDEAIPIAEKNNDFDWLASLNDTYADVSSQKGDYRAAWEFQRKAMKFRDLDNRKKGADQVRLLAALLDLKNKELKIQSEEKKILIQSNRMKVIELWLVIAALLVAGSVFTTFILQQRSRARFQKQQIGSAKRIIEMEETEKGRTARELHDLTGQLVMGISGTIENIDFPDAAIKEQIKGRIKELGASIRHISHRMNRAMIEHFTFSEMITGLCEDLKKLSKMNIDLEMDDEFPDLPNEMVLHIYRITQELLTNAGKYARDSHVKIKVQSKGDKLTLLYSDDGPGFNQEPKDKPSMGILNIFERAKLIGGHADLKSAPGEGTSWKLVFPLAGKL